MSILEILRKDHATVKSLFNRFDRLGKNSQDKKLELFEEIRRDLQLHSRAEEEIVYPYLKNAGDNKGRALAGQATREHREVDQLLTQISRLKPSDVTGFNEKMEALIENVEHHIEEEEGEIFQFAKENLSEEELNQLGIQFEQRKQSLERQMAA